MYRQIMRKCLGPLLLAAASLLGGCYYSPYPYGGYYGGYPGYPAYAYGPPIVGGVVIGGGWFHGGRYYR